MGRPELPAPSGTVLAALRELFPENDGHYSAETSDRLIYGRDCMPGGMIGLRKGRLPPLPDAIVFASNTEEISAVLRLAQQEGIPVTTYGGGSGVCGGAVPSGGGIVLDTKRLSKISPVRKVSNTVNAEAGANGEIFERTLNRQGYTMGHYPSSIYCSTVGGWIAARSAGQLSTKYGKIEDMVVGLEGVLANGDPFRTVTVPRSAAGPDLRQILIGSEGTLAVITAATLEVWPLPFRKASRAFLCRDFVSGQRAIRDILQRDCRPSLVRLYDEADTALQAQHLKQNFGKGALLLLQVEGETELVDAELEEIDAVAGAVGTDLGAGPVEHWLGRRYAVNYNLSRVLPNPGMVLDTMEVAAFWRQVPALYAAVKAAAGSRVMILCHLSHAYVEGACLYFSFMGNAGTEDELKFYRRIWDDLLQAVRENGGTVSHHHGVGSLKAAALREQNGPFQEIFRGMKRAVDPAGILNPGKLGL